MTSNNFWKTFEQMKKYKDKSQTPYFGKKLLISISE